MPTNRTVACIFDANILKLFQSDSMKYAILQDHHLLNHQTRQELHAVSHFLYF